MQRGNISKTRKEKSNVSQKRVEQEARHSVHRCRVAISQKPSKKNPEKGRGLGHVTPQIYGVHPNVPPKRVELET